MITIGLLVAGLAVLAVALDATYGCARLVCLAYWIMSYDVLARCAILSRECRKAQR